ncbi:MAG: ABC transporter ATP-binding protein [Ruminococcaceae bacterium]|nr:ABC transporter ATP-binding protein [Oscillospiraceae bacterium]
MIKTLAKSIREYKRASILTPLFVSLEVIIECMIPFITAKLITVIELGEGGFRAVIPYGIILVVLAALSLTFGALAGHYCAVASCGFAKNLRHDMYYAVQDYSFANIDKFSSSSLVTRMTTDVSNVQMSYMMLIRTAIRCPFMLIFALIMVFVISPRMSIGFAVIVPVLAIGLAIIIKNAHPIFKSVFKKYDNLNNSIQENVHGMRVVKSYVREDHEKKKFAKASDEVAGDFKRAEKILALNTPLMQLCFNMVMLFVCFFGTRLVVRSNGTLLHVGEMSAILTYGAQILMSLMMVSVIMVMIALSAASATRISEVLNEKSTITNPENPVREVADGSVEFKNVSFCYGASSEKKALANIDLSIASGETVGIVGGTGSGKTSLVQLISRLYDTDEGAVLVGGVNVKDYDLEALRTQVATVLQKNVLFSGTIKENIRWGDPDATDEEIERICKLAAADDFIKSFPDGYDTYIEQGGSNVSGGQKQRLCIARALIRKPKILILDDSTSAVDTKTDALIRRSFAEEIPGTTKIIIAQRISSVEHADKIVVLDGGKIESVGTHTELLEKSPIYKEVYNSQVKGGDEE